MTWDPLQRGVLEAMGFVLYSIGHGGDGGGATPHAVMPVDREAPAVDALTRALLRAAARRPDDAEAIALLRQWIPAGGLRDVASRRALWPRLRALRRS